MRTNAIAMDLGSVNTGIYQLGYGVVLFEPSVVALTPDRKKAKAVGVEAKKLIGMTADAKSVVFPVIEGAVDNERAATMMVENFLNKITLKKLSARPQIIASVPCGLEGVEIDKYRKVFNGAGAYSVEFVESPVLAAIGIGAPITDSSPCFIIDIGGGTTDIAAVSLDGVIAGVSVNMGGRNIDAMIINHIEDYFNLKIGSLTAERMKVQIGSLVENDATRTTINGRDIATGKPRSVSVSAQHIRLPIQAFFDKVFEIAGMVMAKLPAEVSAEIRKSGVYFAGGTSKVLGLEGYFREKMAMHATVAEDPELACLIGGGMVAGDQNLLKKLKINRNQR